MNVKIDCHILTRFALYRGIHDSEVNVGQAEFKCSFICENLRFAQIWQIPIGFNMKQIINQYLMLMKIIITDFKPTVVYIFIILYCDTKNLNYNPLKTKIWD